MVSQKHNPDVEFVLGKRHDNGGDFWATADGRLAVGSPFSTLESLLILHELRVGGTHEAVKGAIQLILNCWRDDSRFRLNPSGTLYPCYTANVVRTLCRFGYLNDRRVQLSLDHLLEIPHDDGGWRCLKFSMGRGPETEFSNPGTTLYALDAFRFTEHLNQSTLLDRAVESLLDHWTVRRPIGPCHFGIGTLFMQVEYPFLRYNIFSYVYILSFYDRAKNDERFMEAFGILESKLDADGRMIVERPNRRLAKLALCAKGLPSELATQRYREILRNLESR